MKHKFLLSLIFIILPCYTQKICVHLFVHGTTLPGILILNSPAKKNTAINFSSNYAKIVQKSRLDERFYDDSIMLEPGLIEINQETIHQCKHELLPKSERRKAAIQALTIYDELLPSGNINYYFLYGWSGLLNLECRKQEAKNLYQQLISLKEHLQKKHPANKITFITHAHSHGANIILHLAEEEEKKHQRLTFNKLFCYALPVQIETAHLCNHPMFKKIVHIFSEGDIIQTADKLSTKNKQTFRRISDLIRPNQIFKPIYEILLKANGDAQLFRHRSFFFFNAYQHAVRRYKHFFSSHQVITYITPLPLVILAPFYMKLLKNSKIKNYIELTSDIQATEDSLKIVLTDRQRVIAQTDNLLTLLSPIKQRILKNWQPHAHANDIKKLCWLAEHIVSRILD